VCHKGNELHRHVVKLCLLQPDVEGEEGASAVGRSAGDVTEREPEAASPAVVAMRPSGA